MPMGRGWVKTQFWKENCRKRIEARQSQRVVQKFTFLIINSDAAILQVQGENDSCSTND